MATLTPPQGRRRMRCINRLPAADKRGEKTSNGKLAKSTLRGGSRWREGRRGEKREDGEAPAKIRGGKYASTARDPQERIRMVPVKREERGVSCPCNRRRLDGSPRRSRLARIESGSSMAADRLSSLRIPAP